MTYIYRFESKILFWIIGLFITTIIFSILYYTNIFSDKYSNFPCYISFFLLFVFFLIGLLDDSLPVFFYSFINKKNTLSKELASKNVNDPDKNLEKMIKRYKEVFYNITFSDKEKSIKIIRRCVGFSKEYASKTYLILKDINKKKNKLILMGIFLGVVCFFVLNYINIFLSISKTNFYPLASGLFVFLVLFFKGVSMSKLPIDFYLNIVYVNKKTLSENKDLILKNKEDIEKNKNLRKEKEDQIQGLVSKLLSKGVLKKDIIEIIDSKEKLNFELKELILKSSEIDKSSLKTNYQEIDENIRKIIDTYQDLKNVDLKNLDVNEEIKELNKTIEISEKIRSDDWDYYKHVELGSILKQSKDFEEKVLKNIFEKIDRKNQENKFNYNDFLKELYDSIVPYKKTLTKNKLSSILISRGFSYQVIEDLFDMLKKNHIDLEKNKSNFQTKLIDKINNIYDSFKD